MPFSSLDNILPLKTSQNRLMGLDVGDKTIGISFSDTTWQIATPHSLYLRKRLEQDISHLTALVKDHAIVAIVVGLPLNMNGSEGPQALKVRQFAEALQQSSKLPLVLYDERLSTAAVTRTLLEADLSRRKRKNVVDKMAAAYILQGALDRLRRLAS